MKRGRDIFKQFSPIINTIAFILRICPISVLKIIYPRRLSGKLGMGIRYCFGKCLFKTIGKNVSIHKDVYIFRPDKLEIGDNVSIHPMSYIDANGGITIGNDVSIAHAVTIMSTTHNYKDQNIPIKDQGISLGQVIIGNNIWIGAKAVILKGIRIGNGSVVGASAVVTRDIPENTIVAGIPAKAIKSRI